jgi:hypothetical protein
MNNIPYENGSVKTGQPIAVCFELPEDLTDNEARQIIEEMKARVWEKRNIRIRQLWVHRYDPTLGSSPVFYCP